MRRPPPPRRGLRVFSGRLGAVFIAALVLVAMAGTAVVVLGGRSEDGRSGTRLGKAQALVDSLELSG